MKKKLLLLTILSLLMFIPNIVKAETGNVVFLGNSLINYYDIQSYLLHDNYINSGVAGNTTDDILNNMQERVFKYNPSKVMLLIGVNDIQNGKSEEYIVNNIKNIVNQIKANNPNCIVYVESLYPVNNTNNSKINHVQVGIRNNVAIRNINNELQNIENATYVDVFSKLVDSAGNLKLAYTKEGLHLNSNGYDVVSNVMKKTLQEESSVKVSYSSKSSTWSEEVTAGFTGTTGEGIKLKAFKINLTIDGNDANNQIQYSVYKNNNWTNYTNGGVPLGEENTNNLEAIKIKLVGDLTNSYDIYYRVHSSNMGWFEWAKNGAISGAMNNNAYIEAIEVMLINKNNTFNGKTKYINSINGNLVKFQAHVQNMGWMSEVSNGSIAGTTGKALRAEAFKINMQNFYGTTGTIEYTSYNKLSGWQNYVSSGQIAGTTGKGLAMEAIKIRLTGEVAEHHDVYYRVHVSSIGWLDWAKNDEIAGTIGYGNRIEAIQLKIDNKVANPPGSMQNKNIIKPESVIYQTHVSNIGWQTSVENGTTAGAINQGKQIEAFNAKIGDYQFIGGGVEYSSFVEHSGWQDYVSNGKPSGTTGKGLKIEAIKLRLTGNIATQYDIYYRVYVIGKGWLGWAKNDEIAGSRNYQYTLEGLEIKLVPKGTGEETGNSYIETDTSLIYRTSSKNGWAPYIYDGNISGTTGKGIYLNAFLASLATDYEGSLEYQGHIACFGWTSWIQNRKIVGSATGKQMEAIKIRLTGEVANHYDIYYRCHCQNFGWLGWAKNGEDAGTEGYGYRMEAIQVVLVEKDGPAPGSTYHPYDYMGFYKGSDGYTHYKQRNGQDATDWITINGVKYFFNSLGQQIGANVKKVIDVSSHKGDIDWDKVKASGIDGVILRVGAGSSHEDSKLSKNVAALKRLNIPYGIYLYSYAENQNGTVTELGTAHEAALEAQRIVKSIQKYDMHLSLPIYYDLEQWDISTVNHNWTSANYDPIISNFNRVMSANGYSNWKIYANKAWAEGPLSMWKSRVDWVAQLSHRPTYNGNYSGWQYSFTEHIDGIKNSAGNYINTDASVWFKNF